MERRRSPWLRRRDGVSPDFLPTLFAAILILVVGIVIANFVSQRILIAAVNTGLTARG